MPYSAGTRSIRPAIPGPKRDPIIWFAAAPTRSSSATGWLRAISATETNQIDATAPKKPITRPISPP